jgi:hypothetical protein
VRASYDDIREIAEKAGMQPLWWDTHGVPRYVQHHPDHAADIYANEVVLLRVACQLCKTEQLVQMTWSSMNTIHVRIHAEWAALANGAPKPDVGLPSLAEDIRTGTIHYGDPPYHEVDGEFCHAGCTMNCEDLAVVEYWTKGEATRWEWQRDAALEVPLPTDATEDDRG